MNIIPFKRLCEILSVDTKDSKNEKIKELLELLNDNVIMVKGRMIINSSKKYKEQKQILAHLYTLSLFHHFGCVNQKQLIIDLAIPSEKVVELLRSIALIHKDSRIWFFYFSFAFINLFIFCF